jgi:predicted acylesterase/phospholipase RssA
MVYKHIVLPGGAVRGLNDYGALSYYIKNDLLSLDNIESIHGTSIGAIMGALLCLKHPINEYDDYLINCMYDKIFYVDPENIVNILQSNGLFHSDCFANYIKPFLEANDMNVSITLKEFYEKTNISLYIYVTDVRTISKTQLSHYSHPDLLLVEAIKGSASLPGLFSPLIYDQKLYIDGGFVCNYPIKECIETEGVIPSEVIGINHVYPPPGNMVDVKTFNILDLVFYILSCLIEKLFLENKACDKVNELIKKTTQINVVFDEYLPTISELLESMVNKDLRKKNIAEGYLCGEKYYKSHLSDNNAGANNAGANNAGAGANADDNIAAVAIE